MAIEGHMEVKKHAIRQTQDGWVVSFVIHPNDIKGDFASAPLGTRFMLGYAEVTDEPLNNPAPAADPKAETPLAGAGERSAKAKERYRDAPAWTRDAMRASILCGDPKFQAWLRKHAPIYVVMVAETPEMTAARTVRGLIGAKSSRNEIATDEQVRNRFIALEQQYRIENGLAAELRECQ